MIQFKATGAGQHDQLLLSRSEATSNPAGYLTDISSALHQGLTDAVFKGTKILKGSRRKAMVAWLLALSKVHPLGAMREKLLELKKTVNGNSQWMQAEYEQVISEWSADTNSTAEYEWCNQPEGAAETGVGGYTCGLWTLFHAMLANADKESAEETLLAIHGGFRKHHSHFNITAVYLCQKTAVFAHDTTASAQQHSTEEHSAQTTPLYRGLACSGTFRRTWSIWAVLDPICLH